MGGVSEVWTGVLVGLASALAFGRAGVYLYGRWLRIRAEASLDMVQLEFMRAISSAWAIDRVELVDSQPELVESRIKVAMADLLMARAISVPGMDFEHFAATDIFEQLQNVAPVSGPLPVAKHSGEQMTLPEPVPVPESQSRVIHTSPEAVLGAYRLALGGATRVRRARTFLFVAITAISLLFVFVFVAASLADVSVWWQLMIAVTALATLVGMNWARVSVYKQMLLSTVKVDHYRRLLKEVGVTGDRATEALRQAETMNAS